MPLFAIKDVDRAFFEQNLREFLPERIIDIHAHVWRREFSQGDAGAPLRAVTWPRLVAAENPMEDLAETYRLMFPGKSCSAMVFGNPRRDIDVDLGNGYVAENAPDFGFRSALLCRPEWSAEELAEKLARGGHVGAKVYLNFAPDYIPGPEIRIFDFIPHHQLQVLNDRKAILILHIPRPLRLRDPLNIRQLVEIDESYPDLQCVVAHVGRAYCEEDMGAAWQELAPTGLLFDFCANTNDVVFERAIREVGPARLLYGTDLPITRMRMRRECAEGRYVNVVPPGVYGDVSGDPNMRETDAAEAERLTFFLYEEIDAFRRASERCGLTRDDIEAVFHGNAERLFARAEVML